MSYTRTPRQERSLNPDELAKRLEAFAMLHDSPVKKTPQRRQSNAAYVPRNAGRAFQNTTTMRTETTKEAKRKTLPPGGFTAWGGVDTSQSLEDGFSCAQLAYAHTQLQAYSDELRAKKSSRVLNVEDDDATMDEEEAGKDPDAYKTNSRRPEDRPNWAQGSDDEDENTSTNRLKNGTARMLHLSRLRERERDHEQEAVKRRSNNMDFTQKAISRPDPITRRSSHGDLPPRKPSLYEEEEPNEEEITNYVKSLPRKQILTNNRISVYGSAQDAAIDAAKRAKAQPSLTDLSHQPTSPSRPRSVFLDNDVLSSLRRVRSMVKTPVQSPITLRSKDSTDLSSQASRPDLGGINSEDAAQIRARERGEKALRRRTLQPDFSPSKAEKRSSWVDFKSSFKGVEPISVPDGRPNMRINTKGMDQFPSYAQEIPTSGMLNSSKSVASFPSSAIQATAVPQDSGMSPVSPTLPPSSARASPRLQEYGSLPLSRAPPKTMLVVQAAKKLHDEEVERRRLELQEIRQQEQEERARKRQSYMFPEEGPARTTFSPPSRSWSTTGFGRGSKATASDVALPPRPFTTTGTKTSNSSTPSEAPLMRPFSTAGTRIGNLSVTSPAPPLMMSESVRDTAPLKSAMKVLEAAPKKEKKPNGLRRWFSRYFGTDRK